MSRKGPSGGDPAAHARVAAAAALAVLSAAGALLLLLILMAPGSGFARLVGAAFPIPDVASAEVNSDLHAAAASPLEKRTYISRALRAARREVDAAPLSPKGWLDVSYVAAAGAGSLDGSARAALARSFLVAPISEEVGAWRVGFVLANWRSLDAPFRTAALTELTTLYRDDPARRLALAQAVEACPDPLGRAAGELAMARVGWVP